MRLCFVLLPDAQQLTARSLENAVKEFPDLKKVTWLSSSKGTSAFELGGLNVIAALMPAPVPEFEADHATERSISGLDGSWTLPEHRAHLVVVQQGGENANLGELTTFTRIVAAIVRATHAVGVYWGEASATHHPEFVVNIAQSELPLPVWVGVSVARSARGVELLSIGMKQLGLPDLLLRAPALDEQELEFFYDLLGYVARRGKAIKAGETVGRDEKERLAVAYEKSPVDAGVEVWVVEVGGKKKAAAKAKKSEKKAVRKKAPVVKKSAVKKTSARRGPSPRPSPRSAGRGRK